MRSFQLLGQMKIDCMIQPIFILIK